MGKNDKLILGGAVLLIAAFAFGFLKLPTAPAAIPGAPSVAAAEYCATDDDGLVTLETAVRNPENNALDYNGNPLYAVDSEGNVLTTGTAVAGTSLSYASLTVPCGTQGTVYAAGNSTFESGKADFSADKARTFVSLSGYDASEPVGFIRDSALANMSTLGNPVYDPTSQTQTIGDGGSLTFYLDIQVNASNSGFGDSEGDGVVATIDLTNNAVITANDVTLTGHDFRKVDCSDPVVARAAINNDAEVCYVGSALTSSDGLVRISASARWSAGNPGASDDMEIFFDDLVWFQDTDGSLRKDTFNAAGTNQAVGQVDYTIDVA
ncbi:MAG: hypothetical protein ACE5DI_01270 [Candidatus Micrarchaeia archaeon]